MVKNTEGLKNIIHGIMKLCINDEKFTKNSMKITAKGNWEPEIKNIQKISENIAIKNEMSIKNISVIYDEDKFTRIKIKFIKN